MILYNDIEELISKRHRMIRAFEERKVDKYIYYSLMSILNADIKEANNILIRKVQEDIRGR